METASSCCSLKRRKARTNMTKTYQIYFNATLKINISQQLRNLKTAKRSLLAERSHTSSGRSMSSAAKMVYKLLLPRIHWNATACCYCCTMGNVVYCSSSSINDWFECYVIYIITLLYSLLYSNINYIILIHFKILFSLNLAYVLLWTKCICIHFCSYYALINHWLFTGLFHFNPMVHYLISSSRNERTENLNVVIFVLLHLK